MLFRVSSLVTSLLVGSITYKVAQGRVFETGSNILGKLLDSYCEIPFATATFRSQAALKMDRE